MADQLRDLAHSSFAAWGIVNCLEQYRYADRVPVAEMFLEQTSNSNERFAYVQYIEIYKRQTADAC